MTDTDYLKRCVRKDRPNRLDKVADGLSGKIVVHARGAVGAHFGICGDNSVDFSKGAEEASDYSQRVLLVTRSSDALFIVLGAKRRNFKKL